MLHRFLPPPVVVLVLAAMMWLGRDLGGLAMTFDGQLWLSLLLAATGLTLMLAAAWTLGRARTTIDPTRPEKSKVLVTTGIYRYSRNPIYLGDLLLLLAWAVYLGNPLNLVPALAFVPLMNRFQIRPEEQVLARHIPSDYLTYRKRTRRWL